MSNVEQSNTPVLSKTLAAATFTVVSASVVAVGAISAMVLKKTISITLMNAGHFLQTKGRVWNSSKFRNFQDQ